LRRFRNIIPLCYRTSSRRVIAGGLKQFFKWVTTVKLKIIQHTCFSIRCEIYKGFKRAKSPPKSPKVICNVDIRWTT